MSKVYIVYRVYEDMPIRSSNMCFYGWTSDKDVLKAFLKQRKKKKYTYKSIKEHTSSLNDDNRIDYIKLRSTKTLETTILFLTLNEMREVECNIQRLARETCSLANITSDGEKLCLYINAIVNLKDKYAKALDMIGYQPPEIETLFDSVHESITDDPSLEEHLEVIYKYREDNPSYRKTRDTPPGAAAFCDVCKKILYSLESFVKVMKDDL